MYAPSKQCIIHFDKNKNSGPAAPSSRGVPSPRIFVKWGPSPLPARGDFVQILCFVEISARAADKTWATRLPQMGTRPGPRICVKWGPSRLPSRAGLRQIRNAQAPTRPTHVSKSAFGRPSLWQSARVWIRRNVNSNDPPTKTTHMTLHMGVWSRRNVLCFIVARFASTKHSFSDCPHPI